MLNVATGAAAEMALILGLTIGETRPPQLRAAPRLSERLSHTVGQSRQTRVVSRCSRIRVEAVSKLSARSYF